MKFKFDLHGKIKLGKKISDPFQLLTVLRFKTSSHNKNLLISPIRTHICFVALTVHASKNYVDMHLNIAHSLRFSCINVHKRHLQCAAKKILQHFLMHMIIRLSTYNTYMEELHSQKFCDYIDGCITWWFVATPTIKEFTYLGANSLHYHNILSLYNARLLYKRKNKQSFINWLTNKHLFLVW